MRYYVTVELFGVEAESLQEAEASVREQIERLGLGAETPEVNAEQDFE